ncbi:MAG: AAA family ATPase [Planctomycetota bacterium]|nr:AAA family ATPase [Planctomycetota bacterium]
MSEDFLPLRDFDEIQQRVLAAAVQGDPSVISELSTVRAGLDEPYKTLAAIVCDSWLHGGFIDLAILKAKACALKVGNPGTKAQSIATVIDSLAGVPILPGGAAAYLHLLRKRIESRQLKDLKTKILAAHSDEDSTYETILHNLSKVLTSTAPTLDRKLPDNELKGLPEYVRSLELKSNGGDFTGLNTGFDHLNRVCNGLGAGFHVIAAEPGAGKTTFAWQIANNVANLAKVPVIYINYEQSKAELREKTLSRKTCIDTRHFRRGKLALEDPINKPKILAALGEYAIEIAPHTTIVEADEKTTAFEIEMIVQGVLKKAGATSCLLVVDYLQLIPLSIDQVKSASNAMDRVTANVSALRRIARKLNVSVLAICSENRAGYKKKNLSVFKETGNIEYGADTASLLKTSKTPGTEEYRCLDLHVVKNRNGETARIGYKFYQKTARFVEVDKSALDPEDDAE